MPRPIKPRAKLAAADVIDIFKLKTTFPSAKCVGRMFEVSEKAIRDIWKGRTWAKETWHLDMARLPFPRTAGQNGRKELKTKTKIALCSAGPVPELPVPALIFEPQANIQKSVAVFQEQVFRPKNAFDQLCYVQTSPQAEPKRLDDLLFDWELHNHFTFVDPFARDWALAMQKLTGKGAEAL